MIHNLSEEDYIKESLAIKVMIAGGMSEEEAINLALQTRTKILSENLFSCSSK